MIDTIAAKIIQAEPPKNFFVGFPISILHPQIFLLCMPMKIWGAMRAYVISPSLMHLIYFHHRQLVKPPMKANLSE